MFDPGPNTKYGSASLKMVLNGDFPKEALRRMGRERLEKFVLKLVQCSSDSSAKEHKDFPELYRGLCLKEINRPKWWPSESIIAQSLTADGKYFMEVLRFLVYKCCEFFKKPTGSLNDRKHVTGVKRKRSESPKVYSSKRRTLIPPKHVISTKKPSQTFDKVIIIKLKDILWVPPAKPLTQDMFLKNLGLHTTHSAPNVEEPVLPTFSHPIKYANSDNIPFSSDLGLELKKRDNHKCLESVISRRLERQEWYVNKPPGRCTEPKYDISYQEKKEWTFRSYKFPKRQMGQHPGDGLHQKANLCKGLMVYLVKQNLEQLQEEFKQGKGR